MTTTTHGPTTGNAPRRAALTLTALQRAVVHRLALGWTVAEVANAYGSSNVNIRTIVKTARERNGFDAIGPLVVAYSLSPDANRLQGDPPPFPTSVKRTPPGRGFGAALKAHRERAAMSQSTLAGLADLEHSYVSRLESGSRKPGRDALDALADALGLDSNDRARLFIAAGFWPSHWPARHADVLLGKGGAA